MKLKRLAIIAGSILTSISLPLHAADFRQADLMGAYYQALKSDPTFKKARADWESAKENLPIARAAYLTQVSITGNAQRQYNNLAPPLSIPNSNGYNYDYGFVLSVQQPIFNLPAWDAIQSAKASVKAATATFSSAGQDLMVRTVKAYVSVLQAYDALRFQLARKRAVLEQLKVARQQFKVGLIAITGVYDARSVYDQAVAQSIADQNTLNDAVEQLAEITGIHYLRLHGIGKQVPLIKPQPNDINVWADTAERQNYGLIAQNFTVISTRETLKQQSTNWLPQLNIAGQYTNDNQTSLQESGLVVPSVHTNNVLAGFTLNFPIIQGGLVTANTRQAKYNYLSASSQREFTYRQVISDTRQSFLGIITGISKIKADWQSVISAQNALNATKAGYEVGTRTMVDVLDDVTSLYQAQQQYTDDQCSYIIDTIELKFNAGTLSVSDLQAINRWLRQPIKLNLPKEALQSLQSRLQPIKPFPKVPYALHKPARHHHKRHAIGHTKKVAKAKHKKSVKTAAKKSIHHHPKKTHRVATHHHPRKSHRMTSHHRTHKKTAKVAKKKPTHLQKKTHHSVRSTETWLPKTAHHKKAKTHKHTRIVKMYSRKPKPSSHTVAKSKVVKPKVTTAPLVNTVVLDEDERVIPLYEGPSASQRKLPNPS